MTDVCGAQRRVYDCDYRCLLDVGHGGDHRVYAQIVTRDGSIYSEIIEWRYYR